MKLDPSGNLTSRTEVGRVVDEMDKFIVDFEASQGNNELADFWLRKSKKAVLAVLLVEKNGVKRFYRGTNMEVSMPTGSLCAERNGKF
jgi:cytidine deaminase